MTLTRKLYNAFRVRYSPTAAFFFATTIASAIQALVTETGLPIQAIELHYCKALMDVAGNPDAPADFNVRFQRKLRRRVLKALGV